MIIFALAALFQVATAPVSTPEPDAQQQPPPAAEAPPTAAPAPETAPAAQPDQRERRYCRHINVTGSRVARLVCSSQRVDDDIADAARDGLNRLQSQMPAQAN